MHNLEKQTGTEKYDVVILYESKERELDSVVLLSAELKRRGFSAKIVNTFSYQVKKQKKIETKVIVVPFLYDNLEIYEYVYKICGDVQHIVNLRWEQIFSGKDELDMNYFAYPKNYAGKAMHISWSDYLTELLVRAGVEKSNILTAGAVHMDFLRKDFRTYFLSRNEMAKKYNLPDEKVWKLFVSSFSYTTLNKEELKRYEQTVSDETYEFLEVQIKSKEAIIQWFEHYLQKTKDDIVIYRPHPAERNDSKLIDLERKYPNFRIIRDESFRQWLVVVDEVYNWRSTCIADAYFCGKKSYILRPFKLKESRELPLMNGMKFIENEEDFIRLKECKDTEPENNKSIEKYYNKKETAAYIIICNQIENMLLTKEKKQSIDYSDIISKVSFKQKFKETQLYFLYIRMVFLFHKKGIHLIKKLDKKFDIFSNNLRNIVSYEEIIKMEDKILTILNDNENNRD